MVWYFARSSGVLRAASARASASEAGVPLKLDALSSLPPPPLLGALPPPLRGRVGEGGAFEPSKGIPPSRTASPSDLPRKGGGEEVAASICAGSICEYSATRR